MERVLFDGSSLLIEIEAELICWEKGELEVWGKDVRFERIILQS